MYKLLICSLSYKKTTKIVDIFPFSLQNCKRYNFFPLNHKNVNVTKVPDNLTNYKNYKCFP